MNQTAPAAIQDGPAAAVQQAPGAGARSSRILVNAGFRAVADIGSKVATAALYIFIARKLGASEFGVYAFALTFAGLVTAIGYFGQDVVLAREVSRDRGQLERYYSNAMLARSGFSIPPLLLALLIAGVAGLGHHTLLVVLLLGFGLCGEYMVQVPFAVFQAYERLEFVTVVLIAQRWITTAAAIAALYLGAGLVAVAGIYCAGTLMGAALGTAMMYRYIARPRLHVDIRGAIEVTRQALPIGIASYSPASDSRMATRCWTKTFRMSRCSTLPSVFVVAYRSSSRVKTLMITLKVEPSDTINNARPRTR